MCLFGLGEAHSVALPIEDGVVLADEHVSQDPQGPGGGGDVQAHEAAQAYGLSSLTDLFDRREKESETGLRTQTTPHRPPPGCAVEQSCTCSVFMTVTVLYCECRSGVSVAPCWMTCPYLEDVLLSGQRVGLPAHVEGDDGQRRDLVTAHHVLKHNHNSLLKFIILTATSQDFKIKAV